MNAIDPDGTSPDPFGIGGADPSGVERGDSVAARKAELRERFGRLRREVDNPTARSAKIWATVSSLAAYVEARTVLMFDSLPGEPETSLWKLHAAAEAKRVFVPESPSLPDGVDIVIAPGLAFDPTGARLGHGGGWYDRYLGAQSAASTRVGVCFDVQMVDWLPTLIHDVDMDVVVTESGVTTIGDGRWQRAC